MTDSNEPSKPDYRGMTVNERLFVAHLLDQFDDAVRAGDRDKLIGLLVTVQIEPAAAAFTVDRIFSDPTRYGRVNLKR
jgi:hypothetical protein